MEKWSFNIGLLTGFPAGAMLACHSKCFKLRCHSGLCLSQQMFQATVPTQQAQAHLVTDLLQEGYEFIIQPNFKVTHLSTDFRNIAK